jgi:hypothetical protein
MRIGLEEIAAMALFLASTRRLVSMAKPLLWMADCPARTSRGV